MTHETFKFSNKVETKLSHRGKDPRQFCIYLLRKFPDCILKNDVMKVGKATDYLNRASSSEYQNADWLYIAYINGATEADLHKLERQILKMFEKKYAQQKQPTRASSYGNEFFHIPDKDEAIKLISGRTGKYRRNHVSGRTGKYRRNHVLDEDETIELISYTIEKYRTNHSLDEDEDEAIELISVTIEKYRRNHFPDEDEAIKIIADVIEEYKK